MQASAAEGGGQGSGTYTACSKAGVHIHFWASPTDWLCAHLDVLHKSCDGLRCDFQEAAASWLCFGQRGGSNGCGTEQQRAPANKPKFAEHRGCGSNWADLGLAAVAMACQLQACRPSSTGEVHFRSQKAKPTAAQAPRHRDLWPKSHAQAPGQLQPVSTPFVICISTTGLCLRAAPPARTSAQP